MHPQFLTGDRREKEPEIAGKSSVEMSKKTYDCEKSSNSPQS